MTDILLLIFGILTVGSALIVVFHPNIVYAAFSLIFTFFGMAGLFIFLSADFVAGIQVLIYVGGILVLILFAIMLSHRLFGSSLNEEKKKLFLPLALGLPLLIILFAAFASAPWNTGAEVLRDKTVADLGELLLDRYILPFELASILLLGALIGAVYLVRSDK
ncbi:MAG TPA: NADH-quinone oxidoreductase subunit J [Bdellovibrionota bacterium]|nr:NADH-quinone oxidoreductase subunit J [Bdellovibrionota bacterium]